MSTTEPSRRAVLMQGQAGYDGRMTTASRRRSLILLALAGGFATLAGACISENNFADRYAESICDKSKECLKKAGAGDQFDRGDCIDLWTEAGEYIVDECDDYSGTLAHKCLKESEDLGCNADKAPQACRDFDEKCGFEQFAVGLEALVEDTYQMN